jgi:hypothetical protein
VFRKWLDILDTVSEILDHGKELERKGVMVLRRMESGVHEEGIALESYRMEGHCVLLQCNRSRRIESYGVNVWPVLNDASLY